MNRIEEDFLTYEVGYKKCKDCETRLFSPLDLDSWREALLDRSRITSEVYETNTKIIRQDFMPILKGEVKLTDADMECLFSCTFDMYRFDYEDPFILRQFLSFLLPYYEKQQNTRRLAQLYVMSGFVEIEISRTGDKEAGRRSVDFYSKATQLAEEAGRKKDAVAATYVYIAFVNLCSVEQSLHNVTDEESRAYIERFRLLHETPEYQDMEEATERMRNLVSRLDLSEIDVLGLPFTEEMCEEEPNIKTTELIHSTFAQQMELHDSVYELSPILVFNEYCLRVREGVWDWDKAYLEAEKFFEVVDQTAAKREDLDLLQFEMSVPLSLLYFLNLTQFSEEEKGERADRILDHFVEFVRSYPAGINSYTMIDALQIFTFNPVVMHFLKDTDTRRRFVFTLLVARQPVTCIHCSMVARLASILLPYVFDKHPEWLIGTLNTESVEEVRKQRRQILEFTEYAAMLHDIGKNNMIEIVGTEYRAITDEEFAILKTHPEKGAEYLGCAEEFRDYADVALGHHQFYDAEGGYPSAEVFDHRKSPVRFLIELITLCDCLDAATDDLGRNYHKAKSFKAVLQEFERGAGHQYHPGLVQLIQETPELQEELQNLVSRDRGKVCYEVYKQFFRI